MDDIPFDTLDFSLECWVRVGRDMLVTRRYVKELIRQGWQGTEAIPEEFILDV